MDIVRTTVEASRLQLSWWERHQPRTNTLLAAFAPHVRPNEAEAVSDVPQVVAARPRDTVVLGGSAGALVVVKAIVGALPADFGGSLFVVLHRDPRPPASDGMVDLLSSHTALPTHSAHDGQPITPGHVYVAPADHHMVLANGLVRLERSPREHGFRPSVDVLFKSAAMHYGRRVVGVLLSGTFGSDGTAGLWQIRHCGGVTIVQDPNDADFPKMPKTAIENVPIDFVLPSAQIAAKLTELVSTSADRAAAVTPRYSSSKTDASSPRHCPQRSGSPEP